MVVASGPFTSSENLRFSALHSFLEFVQKMKPRPQVAILVGHSVDVFGGVDESRLDHLLMWKTILYPVDATIVPFMSYLMRLSLQ